MIRITITSKEKDMMPSERYLNGRMEFTTLDEIRNFTLELAANFNPSIDERHLIDPDSMQDILNYLLHPRWNKVFNFEFDEFDPLGDEEDDEETLDGALLNKILENALDEVDEVEVHKGMDSETFVNSIFDMLSNRLIYWKELLYPDVDSSSIGYLDKEDKYLRELIKTYFINKNLDKL